MDIIKFNNPISSTKMEQAEVINGFKTKMWIERYLSEGEFTLTAPVSSGIREKLPIGSLISHINTTEIMIVENHEINDSQGNESEIIITGRGFETFFENRIVGSNKNFPVSGVLTEYILNADYTWNQAVILLNDHILASNLIDDDYAIPYVSVLSLISGSSVSIERAISRGTLYTRLLELLSIDNLGIKIIRPGVWSPLAPESPNIAIIIHTGVDRTNEVIFSYDTGEITSADYLWSNKKLKNAALITGKWVETVINPPEIEYNRRMIFIDASDIDEGYTEAPTGSDLTNVIAAMQQRGNEILSSQNNVILTKAEISREASKSIYRIDFDVGDLITVSGDYNEVSSMRISEYVEIEDETGESGYPTLTME